MGTFDTFITIILLYSTRIVYENETILRKLCRDIGPTSNLEVLHLALRILRYREKVETWQVIVLKISIKKSL